MPNSQTESQSQSEFPFTLAEVLFAEMYGDRSNQTAESDGGKLNRKVEEGRKKNCPGQVLSDGWFTAEEQQDWEEKKKASDEIVPIIYQAIHDLLEPRSALCLSGGGIRSATFNLGLLQGLARNGLLDKFDYLSTVSGGSFIGGWLTAWIHRVGLGAAVSDLGRKRPVNDKGQPTPLEPEPKPVANLRVYSNYLTPKKGLLSPDTWTLIAVYLRNLMLNWLVFLPAIMTALMLPRIWAKLVSDAEIDRYPRFYLVLGFLGVAAGIASLVSILANLPSVGNLNWKRRTILLLVVFMLCLTAIFLCLYWMGIKKEPALVPKLGFAFWRPFVADLLSVLSGNRPGWPSFVLVGALIPAGPLLFLSFKGGTSKFLERALSVVLVFAGGAVTGILTYVAVQAELLKRLADLCAVSYELLYSSLAVPAVLLVLMIGGTLVAGFSSRFSKAEDQEWWARCGAWTLIIMAAWAVVSLLVMFGPLFLVSVPGLFEGKNFGSTKSVITTVIGMISGAVTLLGGFSSKTPASKEQASSDWKPKLLGLATSAAATVFALFLIILLVWLTDWLLLGIAAVSNTLALSSDQKLLDSIRLLPIWVQLFTTTLLFVVAAVAGYLINTNRFSLHYYWRNRMVRAYLGASNPARDDERDKAKVANHFTGFAESDGIRMSQIAGGSSKKLFHIINIALNLAGGEKLEWQDRKCESFTISPLHSGSYWLGYRRSQDYARGSMKKVVAGEPTGISLGTAVAISGAAASPNMGYMMTSPIVRFLMTLFNVRLGFWLGNPGVRGSGRKPTFDLDSPTQSVRPIVAEALGMTDGKSPYVYLSDGGHFENFGLYEMVLRRCRFIVVSDASTDTEYNFDSLAMAIRQIRVDFGVPIDIKKMCFGSTPKPEHDYCALGKIRYSCVDKKGETDSDDLYDGVLIYLKPSLNEDEPRDVLNYHSANPTFPEETIADQWFSEAQFESYRALANHMVERICREQVPVTSKTSAIEKFGDQARAHIIRRPRP